MAFEIEWTCQSAYICPHAKQTMLPAYPAGYSHRLPNTWAGRYDSL
jgi:hypothetical protein